MVVYNNVWPHVNLEYTVSAAGVEEDIVVTGPPGRSSFDFSTGTVSYTVSGAGGMSPVGAANDAATLSAPLVRDGSYTPLEGASPALSPLSLPGGPGVEVSVDPNWTPPSYPYVIDPSFQVGTADMWNYKSDGYACGGCGLQMGNSLSAGNTYWRAVGSFNVSSLYGDATSGVSLAITNQAAGTANVYPFSVWWASAFSYSGAAGGNAYLVDNIGSGGTYSSSAFSQLYNSWTQGRDAGALGFLGSEQSGLYTYKYFNAAQLYATYWTFPSAPTPTGSIANGATYHGSLTPTLTANGSTNADGTALQYQFEVSTDSTFASENCSSSFATALSWQIPAGCLGWNATYYWRVVAWDGQYDAAGNPIETPGSAWHFTTVDSPPSSPGLVSPGSSSSQTIDTSTTAFSANQSTDPDAGDTIQYRFQVATGADGQTGRLINSGWQSSTTWTPPTGTFQDGGIYYWTAQAQDNFGMTSPWSQPLQFKVDFRLGSDTRLPYDTEGPVSVNLSTGNAVVTAGGPRFQTVGGPVGVSFNYNSQAAQNYGLTGTYWQDPRGTGAFPPNSSNGQVQVLTRQDTSLNFNWGNDASTDGPAPGTVAPDDWEAVWTGYITTPNNDQYEFIANKVDDQVTATVSHQQVLSANFYNQGPTDAGTAFNGGQNLPITIDYLQWTGPEYLDIQYEDISPNADHTVREIPADWFSPTASALPDGWSRTGNSFSAGYTGLRSQSATSVAVVDGSGAEHMFTSTGGIGWTPPPGEDSTLTKNSDGTWTLIGDDGYSYDFAASGELSSVTSPTDDAHRGAPTYNYAFLADGVTSRLLSIADATGRTMTLQYSGESGVTCPTGTGFDATAPTDMLCRVSYDDQNSPPTAGFGGGETDLYYSNGNLARITNPGAGSDGRPTTDFLYCQDAPANNNCTYNGVSHTRLLTGIRDQLTNDLIANGVITDAANLGHFTQIAYDSTGRVTGVTLPEPDASGVNVPQHTYGYPSAGATGGTTTVTIAGETTTQGWARQVVYDAGGHATTDTGADNIAVNYTWDDLNDRLLATIDHHYAADPAHGVETTSLYDAAGNVTDTYGPAPATTFTSTYTSPNAPHSTTTYDQGFSGLGGAWYTSASPSGVPAFHNNDPANDSWGTGSPSTGSATPSAIPPANISSPFSGVLTGQATLTQPGKLSLSADGAQVWVDDHQVINAWGGPYAAAVTADGPTNWWRLGDPTGAANATDQTNADPGTYQGAPAHAAGQHSGDGATATYLDGSSQYVTIPPPSGATTQAGFQWFGVSPFTIDAWIDPTGSSPSQHYARVADFGTGAGTNNVILDLGPDGTELNFTICNNSTCQGMNTAAGVVTYNGWQHVAVTFAPNGTGGGTAILYRNGVQVASQTFTVTPAAVTYTSNAIGKSNWTGDPYFVGDIQDVALYQTALTSTRLAAHYSAGPQTQTTTTSPTIWNTPYPQAVVNDTPADFWRLGDPSGASTATDSYGTNNGTYTSVTLGGTGADPNDPTATSAGFNGNSEVSLPSGIVNTQLPTTIEAWFKTSASGVIFSVQNTAGSNYVPVLYVGTDAKLRGELWNGSVDPITTAGTVTGAWHHAVLASTALTQTLYLDGNIVGTLNGQVQPLDMTTDTIGTGKTSSWPNAPTGTTGFNGSLQDVALYNKALAGPTVAAHDSAASAAVPPFSNVHRIRIQVQQLVAGGGLTVTLPTGGTLQPRYGLETSSTDTNGHVTTTSYTNGSGLTPAFGLTTSSTVDPSGLNLVTATGYETLGSGYLRQTSRTLPAGGQTTFGYYGQGANPTTANNPCPSGATNIPQGGALWTSTDAQGIVNENVYDEAGRILATRVQSDGVNWTCSTYDTRGRPLTVVYPALFGQATRTASYNYAVTDNTLTGSPANPAITAVTDTGATCVFGSTGGTAGCVTTKVDWDGRVIAYTDTWGDTTTTTYDQAGRVTQTSGPAGTQTIGYDNADRPNTQGLDNGTIATATYDPTSGLPTSYSYPSGTGNTGNGTSQAVAYDTYGRTSSLTYTNTANATITSSTITSYSQPSPGVGQGDEITGELIDGTALNSSGPAFSYDNAGRLTDAYAPGHHYTYNFATTTGCSANNAGLDSNRTSYTDNGITVASYCYSQADKLVSTTDSRFASVTCPGGGSSQFCYDNHGNITNLGSQTLGYDAADRNITMTTGSTTVTYKRDATNRITERDETTGATTTVTRYGFTGGGDSADLTLNSSNVVVERDISVLGGVLLTKRGTAATDVWSYPNIHGDIQATADGSGNKTGGTYLYDPFGNALSGQPDNSAGDYKYGWEGKHQKGTDITAGGVPLIQMGARLYAPSLGRFLQTDPIPGGSANAYDYCFQDPINCTDLNGEFGWSSIGHLFKKAAHFVRKHWKAIAITGAVIALNFVPVAGEVADAEEAADIGITGYTREGLARAIARDGHGVSPRAILDAVRNPVRAFSDVARRTSRFEGADATVVLNEWGRVVTTWARNSGGWRY